MDDGNDDERAQNHDGHHAICINDDGDLQKSLG